MKVLMLSLDRTVLEPDSAATERLVQYGALAGSLTVLVPTTNNKELMISGQTRVFGCGGKSKLVQWLKLFGQARRLVAEEKFNLITTQDIYFLGLVGVILARLNNLPLEVQVHGFEKTSWFRLKLARFVLNLASGVRVVSQRLALELVGKLKIAASKIYIIPINVDIAIVKPEVCPKQDANKFIFLTVARLVPVKNVDAQLRALAEIKNDFPNIELWIVGDGPERQRLQALAKSLDLTREIKWLGWQKNPEIFYCQADVFLLTSVSEGWGLAVLEAAAAGLPIIMTDVGLAGEIIKDKVSGLIVPVGRQAELIQAMKKMLVDKNLREAIGRGALICARNLPSSKKTIEDIVMNWRKLTEAKN